MEHLAIEQVLDQRDVVQRDFADEEDIEAAAFSEGFEDARDPTEVDRVLHRTAPDDDPDFTERRAGKRFDDFLSERMKGRNTVTARLDKQGQTTLLVNPGNWWLHALLAGDEQLEWRLPVTVGTRKQTVELTSDNVYTRTRSF